MAQPKGNQIHVYDGAAETIPCPYGEPFPDLPTSFALISPTAGGKSILLINLLLRFYKDQFARIWFFSPSIKLDPQYAPLRKYLEKMADQDKEPLMFEDMDQSAIGKILDEQRKITEECRKRKIKPPQVCVVVDDMADRGDILTKRQGGINGGSWMVTLARERLVNNTVKLDNQVFIRTPGYKNDYGDGSQGWAIERGMPPKPLGSAWLKLKMRATNETKWIEYDITSAK